MTSSSPGADANVLERGASWLETVLACALLAAVAMNFVNVVARYVFGRSLEGADELQIYLMVALAFFGSVVAMARRQHLRMDVLTRYFPGAMRRLLDGLESVGAVVLCGFVCWISTGYAIRMHQIGSVSENAHIPLWIPHGVVGLAFACMTLVSLAQLFRRASAPRLDERSALAEGVQ
ncbi:MAG: TRAP transporter small permease [Ottowia sp.]|uniref:TRAP transporter small permease n=1 Tax=unclassified Ottowia TaxID=2645081 RepID=UPI003C30606B